MKISHSKLITIARKNNLKISLNEKKISLKLMNFIIFLKSIEEQLEKNYHPDDKMKCPVHFCHGQESVPAALYQLLTKNDYLFSHHRSHGYYLSKKCPPEKLFAELYGKSGGANGGIAGSQDISFSKNNFYSGAIIAGAISIAVGAALSLKLDKKKNIAVCGFGESAADQGIFWESLNYASLSKIPLLFICENNDLSVLSPQKKRQSGESIAFKAKSFGVNSVQVYGNDPIKVYNTIKKAIFYIKKYQKPFLIESFTYRSISHVGPLSDDVSNLKLKKEYKFWLKNSPYENLKKELLKKKYINKNYLTKKEKESSKLIKKYFAYAEKSKFPKFNFFENLNYYRKYSKEQNKINILKTTKIQFEEEMQQVKGY
jgi:TPP-dependent pyruvate/acetoin dehydrogenase alpha subunit